MFGGNLENPGKIWSTLAEDLQHPGGNLEQHGGRLDSWMIWNSKVKSWCTLVEVWNSLVEDLEQPGGNLEQAGGNLEQPGQNL